MYEFQWEEVENNKLHQVVGSCTVVISTTPEMYLTGPFKYEKKELILNLRSQPESLQFAKTLFIS